MLNKNKHIGQFKIIVKNSKTKEIIKEEIINNRIMDAALSEIIKGYTSTAPDIAIKYIAIGTGDTAITDTDTTLDTEVFRKLYTIPPTLTDLGTVETKFDIIDTEAQVLIKELGIFGGSTASATPDSGVLISRILWDFNKTPTDLELEITRIDKVVRG